MCNLFGRAFDTFAIFILLVNYGLMGALKRPYFGVSRIYVIGHTKLISTTPFQVHVLLLQGYLRGQY